MNAKRVNESAFDEIFSLIQRCTWLADKSGALVEIYNLCDTPRQQELIMDLLNRFIHVDSQLLDMLGRRISQKVVEEWGISRNNGIFIATADPEEAEVDGSQGFLQALKNKFAQYGWSNRNFVSAITAGVDKVQENFTVLLFDDYIGSGKTIRAKYTWFKRKMLEKGLVNFDIKVIAYAAIESTVIDLNLEGIAVFAPQLLRKGISEYDDYSQDEKALYVLEMIELEQKLRKYCNNRHLKTYSLGYEKSESIYAVEGYNISDNTFPIFWWPETIDSKRLVLFDRLD